MQILVVEDDRQLAEYIRRSLEEESHTVKVCFDGATGLKAVQRAAYDIVVLDVMMPFMDGLEVTRRLRLEGNRTPVLLLTARDAPEDIVRGLDAGADDYLTKPFSFDVLFARLRARTRAASAEKARLQISDLTMDLETREVRRGSQMLPLTRTEFALLECLMAAAGRVVTRDRLIEAVWGEREISDNNLEVFIRFLRTKVDLPGHTKLIQTERGVGYSIRESK